MKHNQQGFIGIVIAIIVAVVIGGVAYYHHKSTQKVQLQMDTTTVVDTIENSDQDQKPPLVVKKPVTLSFEAKARAAAQAGECGKMGTIGAATRVQEEYDYALFSIEGSNTANYCSVDLYANKIEAISTRPVCDANGQNCHGTGLLPTPRKEYEAIPVVPDPSTLR